MSTFAGWDASVCATSSDRPSGIVSDPGQGEIRAEATSGGSRSVLGALLPIVDALRTERTLVQRRPEIGAAQLVLREQEVDHWRPLLDGSPTLGTLVDQAYEETENGVRSAVTAAHRILASATILVGLLVVAISLPAIGQMFDVSPWLLIAVAYGGLAQIVALRASRLRRGLARVGLDTLDEPLARARSAHGEQSRGVLLVEVRARRAAATESNRALAGAVESMVDAASACLRNALVAIVVWLVLNALPQSIAAAWRGLTSGFGG